MGPRCGWMFLAIAHTANPRCARLRKFGEPHSGVARATEDTKK